METITRSCGKCSGTGTWRVTGEETKTCPDCSGAGTLDYAKLSPDLVDKLDDIHDKVSDIFEKVNE